MTYAEMLKVPPPHQRQPLDKRQVMNNAGGYVYKIDPLEQSRRFLVLGTDKPTYYQTAKALTIENAGVIIQLWKDNPIGLADQIIEISTQWLAPKPDPVIFALALGMCSDNVDARRQAAAAVHYVCRTGTHLFQWVDECKGLGRGWGKLMRKTVAAWYESRHPDKLAYQMVKYRQREGWAHGDLVVKGHPHAGSPGKVALYRWALIERGLVNVGKNQIGPKRTVDVELLPHIVRAHIDAMKATTKQEVLHYQREYNLPWEALPTEANAWPELWEQMAPTVGLTALIRNLGRMTQMGVISPMSDTERVVAERLESTDELTRGKIHPFNLLMAYYVYKSGMSIQGFSSWKPSQRLLGALDYAFDQTFCTVEPTGKRRLIALDVSGSMYSMSPIMQATRKGLVRTPMYAGDAAACMALVTMRREQNWYVTAFADTFRELRVSGRESLDGMLKAMRRVSMGGTDCALPMRYATKNRIPVDCFEIYTDNETWVGSVHPMTALKEYRQRMGINAKLVTVGMTSTGFSIADPEDSGTMDVVGFDRSAPSVMADFIRGGASRVAVGEDEELED